MNYVILTVLALVTIYNIFLSMNKRATLSQRYQKLLPTWADMIILGAILTGLCFLPMIHPALRIWIAGICGHICWPNKERYGNSS